MLADYADLLTRSVVYVLEDDGSINGLIVLWPDGDALYVDNVAVDPRYQGQGLGRRLMAFAEAQARAAGLVALSLYTNEAMTENLLFYRRLGFVETDRRSDQGYRRVFLRKPLTAGRR